MPPFTPEDLESGNERVARLFGAAAWSAVAGYVIGATSTHDLPSSVFFLLPATGPVVTVLLSLPRCAIASYIGRGLAATFAFAFGIATGTDYSDIEPWIETSPGLTFVVTLVLSWLWLLGGLIGLAVAKLLLPINNRDA